MRQCVRCGFPFEPTTPNDTKTNVCDNCADDLRQEEEADTMMEAEDEYQEEIRLMQEG